MATFTTRVVLYGNATWAEYDKLHKQMALRGFSDEITSDDGVVYKMPDAEYDYSGNATIEQVHEQAKAAANAVQASNAVLVTQSAGRLWHGLKEVRRVRRA